MLNVARQQILGWQFLAADQRLRVPSSVLHQLGLYIQNWTAIFPAEKTWVRCNYGVPSLFLSVKCSLNGGLHVMGVDPAPVGIGIAKKINPFFAQMLNGLRETWPQIYVLDNAGHANDDAYWLETVSEEEARKSDTVIIIRAKPRSSQFQEFAGQSATPALSRYDRSYGVNLQMWEEVGWTDMRSLDWGSGFCLKGRDSKALEIWHPKRSWLERRGTRGISTKTRISNALLQESMYCQRLIPPMTAPGGLDGKYMVYKLYYLFDPEKGGYVYAGGVWEAGSSLRIRGSSETIFGPID